MDGLRSGRRAAAKTLYNSVANHVSCGATVNGYAHWVVCVEHIKVRRLASLYAEDMSARTRTRVISVTLWFVCVGSGVKISRVIEDVSDLSGLSDVPTILFRKETAFAKKIAILGSVSLFT